MRNKEKKRMLYCMQVSWFWIKQRPHFIAEGLSDKYDILVFDRKEFRKDVKNDTSLRVRHCLRLPFERFLLVEYVNAILYKIQYFFLTRKNDIIWVTNPMQFKYIGNCPNKTIVYDCMDDMPALALRLREEKACEKYEALLYKRADILFASSLHLKKHLIDKYGSRDIVVVNNAIKDNISEYEKVNFDSSGIVLPQSMTNLTYIGTIASWFNFDMLINLLDKHNTIVLNLFGPSENNVPNHPQIKYYGPIEHRFILRLMERSDVLVMPFIVNDLIRSVNPVKLYEYIYSGKPCVAPRYEESEQFSDYVCLYDNAEEFVSIIEGIIDGTIQPASKLECKEFALNNTWGARIKQIKEYLP